MKRVAVISTIYVHLKHTQHFIDRLLVGYAYEGEWMNWHELTTKQVHEIIKAAKAKKPVASLEEFSAELQKTESTDFGNVVGQDSLTRFDKPKKGNHNNKKRRRKKRNHKPRGKKPNKNA